MNKVYRVLVVGLAVGCTPSEPLTCESIEADGGVCGAAWNVRKNFDLPFVFLQDANESWAVWIPGLQTCMDPSFYVFADFQNGPTTDEAVAALGADKVAEARQASLDKCVESLEAGTASADPPISSAVVESACESYVGVAYPVMQWIEIDIPWLETAPCRYTAPADAAPYEAPLSLVVATPTDSSTATGHLRWRTTCTRSGCTSTVTELAVRLDAPLDLTVGSTPYTLHDGEFTLLDHAVGARGMWGSTVTVAAEAATVSFEGHATTGSMTVPVDGQYVNPTSLQITLPSRGAPSFAGTVVVAGVPVTVTTR